MKRLKGEEVKGLKGKEVKGLKGEEENENQSKSAQSELSEFQNIALENIKLVPNPTTGELRIENGELRIMDIEVFDVYGRNISLPTRPLVPSSTIKYQPLPLARRRLFHKNYHRSRRNY